MEKIIKRIDPMAPLDKRVATESRFFKMVMTALPSYRFTNIFDVGANVGQTCIPMASFLPEARIFAFEPVPLTFSALKNNASSFNNIIPIPLALGDRDGIISMHTEGTSTANYIIENYDNSDQKNISVIMKTGAEFCEKSCINQISLLKIDAEGFDFKVIDGFQPLMGDIDFIKVEAGMNKYNTTHISFWDFYNHLTKNGFMLFHIFEQRLEFKLGGRPVLRRANPVFINARLLDMEGIS